ncbi:hypothetical protein [Marinisporobacter balticus]|uniref:Uncharacterized protein n=1 Tax=Marinisporobacter balticus TaxID=2018667 RepID=A0A4R2KHJ9_9FIRM|nr:hypothetical protein [Marinisporobacter balticus]TCO69478.1 hypothetical protein EV214_1312 [Marinisporobacter balticus]
MANRFDKVKGQDSSKAAGEILGAGKGPIINLEALKTTKPEMMRVSYYISTDHNKHVKEMAEKAQMKENVFVRFMIDKFYEMTK